MGDERYWFSETRKRKGDRQWLFQRREQDKYPMNDNAMLVSEEVRRRGVFVITFDQAQRARVLFVFCLSNFQQRLAINFSVFVEFQLSKTLRSK